MKNKTKITFKAVINKVLVGTILLSAIAGATTPAYASTADITEKYNEAINKYNSSANITQNYEVSVESAIYNVKSTIEAIEQMKKSGVVTEAKLKELATQLTELDRAVNISGSEVTEEVKNVVLDAEKVLDGVNHKRVATVEAVIKVVKESLNINDKVVLEETNKKAVKLSDISKHWGKKYIDYLVNKGGIDGYPDGTFKPDKTISKAEFLSIALRSFNGGVTPEKTTDHWASGLFADAIDKHILMQGEMPASEWNKPITRYEMTVIMVRILQEIAKEEKVSTSGVQNLISDYLEVSKEAEYKYYVEQAYMKGLIAGFSGGRFGGRETGTRAQAATMVVRMLDKAQRETVNTTPTNPATATGVVLKQDDPYRALPKAGDKFITVDGREVILKIHEPTGILGAYQNVSLYEGMVYPDGTKVREGSLGTDALGHAGQPYYIDKSTGTGMFREDWLDIRDYELKEALKVKAPKEGQIVGEWTQYKTMGKGTPWELSDWCWIGPVMK